MVAGATEGLDGLALAWRFSVYFRKRRLDSNTRLLGGFIVPGLTPGGVAPPLQGKTTVRERNGIATSGERKNTESFEERKAPQRPGFSGRNNCFCCCVLNTVGPAFAVSTWGKCGIGRDAAKR
jgi:hypothetical protein